MAEKLSVLIPCKDERLNIGACIASIRDLADEILIADSGSTDGTLDIVRHLGGCRVIEREYVNSADFKNWAIPQARHAWVLLVDADERIPPELADEIRKVLAAPAAGVDAYRMGRLNYFLGYPIRHCGWDKDRVVRLFRRDACRYQPRFVHAEIEVDEQAVRRLEHRIIHYTAWTTDHLLAKLNRYAGWGAQNMQSEAKRAGPVRIALAAPLRFLYLYLVRQGFRDGMPGFIVCMLTSFHSFLKRAKYWEMGHARRQAELETVGEGPDASEPENADVPPQAHDQAASSPARRSA